MTLIPAPYTISPHRPVGGSLAAGAAVVSSVASTRAVYVGSAARIRIRFQASVDGTLSAAFRNPLGVAYADFNPADVTITAATAAKMDIDPHWGEATLVLTFLPAGTGTVTFCDLSMV